MELLRLPPALPEAAEGSEALAAPRPIRHAGWPNTRDHPFLGRQSSPKSGSAPVLSLVCLLEISAPGAAEGMPEVAYRLGIVRDAATNLAWHVRGAGHAKPRRDGPDSAATIRPRQRSRAARAGPRETS